MTGFKFAVKDKNFRRKEAYVNKKIRSTMMSDMSAEERLMFTIFGEKKDGDKLKVTEISYPNLHKVKGYRAFVGEDVATIHSFLDLPCVLSLKLRLSNGKTGIFAYDYPHDKFYNEKLGELKWSVLMSIVDDASGLLLLRLQDALEGLSRSEKAETLEESCKAFERAVSRLSKRAYLHKKKVFAFNSETAKVLGVGTTITNRYISTKLSETLQQTDVAKRADTAMIRKFADISGVSYDSVLSCGFTPLDDSRIVQVFALIKSNNVIGFAVEYYAKTNKKGIYCRTTVRIVVGKDMYDWIDSKIILPAMKFCSGYEDRNPADHMFSNMNLLDARFTINGLVKKFERDKKKQEKANKN